MKNILGNCLKFVELVQALLPKINISEETQKSTYQDYVMIH